MGLFSFYKKQDINFMEGEGEKINWSSSSAENNEKMIPWDTSNKYFYQQVYLTDLSEICSVEGLQDFSEGRLRNCHRHKRKMTTMLWQTIKALGLLRNKAWAYMNDCVPVSTFTYITGKPQASYFVAQFNNKAINIFNYFLIYLLVHNIGLEKWEESASCRFWEKQQNLMERITESKTGINKIKNVSNADWLSYVQSLLQILIATQRCLTFLNTWDQKEFEH